MYWKIIVGNIEKIFLCIITWINKHIVRNKIKEDYSVC